MSSLRNALPVDLFTNEASGRNLPARIGAAGLGVLLWVVSLALYAADGFGLAVGLLWVAGLLLAGAALAERIPLPARVDLIAPLLLMLAFAPLYLIRIASLPVQVN